MDVGCLMLAYVENSQVNRTLWDRAIDAISGMGKEKTQVTEKMRMWREAGNSIGIHSHSNARTCVALAQQRKEL